MSSTPDGRRIVTASVDGTVRVWDVSNGTQVLESAELGGALRFASFSPDGTKVLINAGTVAYIIDAEDGSQIAQLEGHRGSIASAAFSPIGNTVVTAALDFTSRIWDVTNGAQIFRLQRDWNGVTCASYSPDASLVVTGTDKGVCHLWSATTGTWIASVDAHKDSIRCLRFDRDGKRLVVASADATASAWDLSTGELLSRLEGHLGWVTYAVFDSDGSRIATSSRDGSVRVWSTMTGTELSKLEGHAGDVECVAFSADGTQVISSGGGTTRIWDASHCWPHLLMVPGGSAITTAQLSPDGARILTAVDQFVHLWDVLAGDRLATLVGDEHDLLRASFDGDGARILTVESDGDVRVWDALTGVQLAVFHGAVESIDYPNWRRQASAGLCAAGGRVVVASTGGVDLWDVRSGTNLGELEVLGSGAVGVPRCTVNRDGSRVATSVTGEAVHVWDATSGELIATCHPGSDGVDFLEFSADGVRLLMMAAGAASVWDARSGTLVRDSIGGHQSINRVHISPDGALVAVMPSWGSVQVWSVDNGVQLTQLEGHARPVEAIDFSHDGTRIVTTGGDGSVRVWDPRTGVQLLKLDVHLDRSGGAPVWTTVQFSSDGTRLLSSAAGSTVHLWDSVAHRTRFAARLDLQRAQPVAEAYVAEALGHQSNLFDVGERIRSDPTMEPGVRRVALEILIRHADKARIKEEVLRVAQAEHLWISRMLGLEPWPDHEQVEAEIEGDAELPNGSWELDLIASSLVDDHGPLGDPVRALILARRAFAKSGGGALHYTLSQALFRLGRFDEALEHDRLAVASVEEDLRRHFAGRTARLQSDIAAWRDESGQLRREEWMAKLEELDREIAELEADPDVRLWRASQL